MTASPVPCGLQVQTMVSCYWWGENNPQPDCLPYVDVGCLIGYMLCNDTQCPDYQNYGQGYRNSELQVQKDV
jgi:hypothetical protein